MGRPEERVSHRGWAELYSGQPEADEERDDEIWRVSSDVRLAGSHLRSRRARAGLRAEGRGARLRRAVGRRALPGGARPLRDGLDVSAPVSGPRGECDHAHPAGHRSLDPAVLPSGHAGPRDPDAVAALRWTLRARRGTG